MKAEEILERLDTTVPARGDWTLYVIEETLRIQSEEREAEERRGSMFCPSKCWAMSSDGLGRDCTRHDTNLVSSSGGNWVRCYDCIRADK